MVAQTNGSSFQLLILCVLAGREIPVAKVPPKAKEHDPNAIKPKVYGNITVS